MASSPLGIKTTLGMEVLRCMTPAMVEKELWVCLLAYNVIRLLMAQAKRIPALIKAIVMAQKDTRFDR